MEDPKIIRSEDIKSYPLPGADENSGWIKRIIYPPHVVTKGTIFGIAEVIPGYSPHRWHTHTKDKGEGFELIYPKDFEEIYHIISGSGVMQWKTEDGKIKEEKVSAGDTIFFPVGVVEHQLLNNGNERMKIVYCGGPQLNVTLTYNK